MVDVDSALSFYRDVAGFEVAERTDSRASLRSENGPVFLTLDSNGVTSPADPSATGLFHTAFRFPTRTALGDALARLVDRDYAIGAGDHLVSEALYIDDPSGNGVELYWDRPAEEWPPPAGDMLVPMATLPVDLQGLLDDGTGAAAIGESAPTGTDVGHVHLQVSDIDTTTNFYKEILGLDLTGRLGDSAGFFSSNGYHHNIGANIWRSRGQKIASRERAGLERVTFAVRDAAEIGSLRSRLEEGGSEFSRTDSSGIALHDPDGIELRFLTAPS